MLASNHDLLAQLRVLDNIDGTGRRVEGWCSYEKALAMAELAISVKPRVSVELGVFGGRSLIAQAIGIQRANSGLIYGIDPWTKEATLEGDLSEGDKEWWGKLDISNIYAGCLEALIRSKVAPVTRLLCCKSDVAAENFGPESIDILHIDSNHSEKISTREVQTWLPKVSPAGFVWFDDVNWPTTQKALAMVKSKCDFVREIVDKDGGTCHLYCKA